MTGSIAVKKERTLAEPFRIKMVEPLKMTDENYRRERLLEAGFNPFLLNADDVYIDLLTDSGTGAMSERQWAGMMMGDESYAGASSWIRLEKVVKDLCGMPFILPTHQGRAAERILYSIIGGKGKVFISNTHFDTTRANIEYTGALAIDVLEKDNGDENYMFKGNIDIEGLNSLILHHGSENIAAVIMTVTNNSSGGQAVSMQNLKQVREICDRNKIMMVIDGCRVAENSYFISHGEQDYKGKSCREIAKELLRLGDAIIMSAKKDGMVNMGGLLAVKDEELNRKCVSMLIISEGFTTYGGLSGRDMEALAVGLEEVFDEGYLHYRIRSTAFLGERLKEKGVPVLWPVGGHAVYIDAGKLFPEIPVSEFPGQVLVSELYLKGGIRTVEVGSVMFGKYEADGKPVPAPRELVRLAIPRRVYTQSHIEYVTDVFDDILEIRNRNRGMKIIYEPPFLRHFTARFELL